ncbi:formin-mediated actin nucleation enhancer Ecym_1439 [Eremothecium cymbalariae DBVPG|uniref:Actin interacting protein 3 C-terminal domain-containing protein n=1 Tax=Eremothecium cymbalariae (strain CBS 270.75 / DBVPG 7215 / KCTC 17166 / NRRL Y-17582) TaxID=931890 RepID=G8JM94_ERECY|nr:hypothetical protein Ecym_1439 [Eremothecium cymbalariae DBVPG\
MSVPASQRTSRASSTSSTGAKPMSTVESSVTKLLISTKTLLQRLTQWSKKAATESQVSDAYVQLGNDFKLVSKHFAHAGIEVNDLGDVPMELRRVLEVALREPPSEETLNRYLPQIREIIVNLLEKLKAKQYRLKQSKGERRTSAMSSMNSTKSSQPYSQQGYDSSTVSVSSRDSSVPINRLEGMEIYSTSNMALPSVPDGVIAKPTSNSRVSTPKPSPHSNSEYDPLSQLKKGVTLQRRASKRFSAYHMAKLTHLNNVEAPTPSLPTSTDYSFQGTTTARNVSVKRDESMVSEHIEDGTDIGTTKSETLNRQSRYIGDGSTITVFLKLNNKVKKGKLTLPVTFNQIRLLFVEKFTYSPGGDAFPDIYIHDPGYDVAYELEDSQMHYIKDGTLLQLNIEPSTTQSVDLVEKFEKLRKEILESQRVALSEFKKVVTSSYNSDVKPRSVSPKTGVPPPSQISTQVRDIKHELSILSQAHNTSKKSLTDTINHILEKVKKFQSLSFNASTSSNRVYMEQSQTKLSELSDILLAKVDDLQDIIEGLRKDVAIRGAKPTRKKLDAVQNELKRATEDLGKMEAYINIEKPNWKMIWESELDKVCEEQQFLTLQEDLVFDLQEDLNKANETFDLVRLCCEEQEKNPNRSRTNPILPLVKPGTMNELRDRLLSEVQSLNPDHESRVQAIQRAEKLREKELQYKDGNAFELELEDFVGSGAFKRAGGIEEVERLRKERDEQNLRQNFGGI